jgi:hypothetical protein
MKAKQKNKISFFIDSVIIHIITDIKNEIRGMLNKQKQDNSK